MLEGKSAAPRTEGQECWTTLGGLRTRYLCAGSGAPLVLLHGLLGYSFSWRFNIPALAVHRTVYAIDMPGAGFSERCKDLDCTFRGCALRLLDFARNLRLDSFDLVGTSHGGAVAMLAASLANQENSVRVRRLILVAPVNPWSAHGRLIAPLVSGRSISRLLGWCIPRLSFVGGAVVRRLYGEPRRISAGTVEGYSTPCAMPGSFEYVFNILRSWNQDLKELESSISGIADLPVLLIWGGRDVAVDPGSARMLGRHFHNCELVEFPGVGHLPYEEVPQEFNAAVIKFLTQPLPM